MSAVPKFLFQQWLTSMVCFALASSQGRWVEVPLPVSDSSLFVISFADSLHGSITGRNGTFLYTEDSGTNWVARTIPSAYPIRNSSLVSLNSAWVLSSPSVEPGFQRQLLRTTDMGQLWQSIILPDTIYLSSVSFRSESRLFVAGLQDFWTSEDGGQSWEERSSLPPQVWNPAFVDFYDDFHGYAGGGHVFPSPNLAQTTDGGNSWTNLWIWSPEGSVRFRLIDSQLGSFWFFHYNQIWDSWISLTWNRGLSKKDIHFDYPFDEWATPDGWATDSTHFWLLQRNGLVLRTSDAGQTWLRDTLAVRVEELLCNTWGHRFALGAGRLFRLDTTSTGADYWIQLPTSLSLDQNYPNPFNAETTIRFALPYDQFVTLKVFNILGQEVASLVAQRMHAGFHTVQWNAARFPSGVYVYRLESENTPIAHKALLTK